MVATKERVRSAIVDMQQPGTSVEISSGGQSARIDDPRAICLDIALQVETIWTHLDEDLLEVWPVDGNGEPVEFQDAPLAAAIAEQLIQKILRFAFLKDFSIGYVYRHKENWEVKGRTKLGELSRATGLTEFYGNHDFEMKLNWIIWRSMTPWQKIALIYHELRHADVSSQGGAATQGHHFEGFFDELELFGTNTERKKAKREPVVEVVSQELDFDAWVRAYVACVLETDGWRVADPPSVSVA